MKRIKQEIDTSLANFHKIYSEKGIDKEAAIDFIIDLIGKVPEEVRYDFASELIIQAVIFGSGNTYEGIGMCEAAKMEYLERVKEVYAEKNSYSITN